MKKGTLIIPRGNVKNKDIFEVIFVEGKYIQALGLKDQEFIRFPKTFSSTYRIAKDADIKSYVARHLKYHLIQEFGENGTYKLSEDYIAAL